MFATYRIKVSERKFIVREFKSWIGNLKEKNVFRWRQCRSFDFCENQGHVNFVLVSCSFKAYGKLHRVAFTWLEAGWWILEYLASANFVLASESNLSRATGPVSWKVSLEPCLCRFLLNSWLKLGNMTNFKIVLVMKIIIWRIQVINTIVSTWHEYIYFLFEYHTLLIDSTNSYLL